MVQCLLCLKSNRETEWCIEVDSPEWIENKIKELIEKHLWPIDTIKRNAWLCHTCWEEIKDFHNFYNRIEEAQNDFKSLLKTEINLWEEDNKPKDLQLAMLLEPEVALEQMLEPSVEIKQELDEPTNLTQKEYQNQQDIVAPDHELHEEPKFDVCSFSQEDSNDDLPLIRRQSREKNNMKKSSIEPKSSKDYESEDEYIGEYESKSDSDADPLRPSEDGEAEPKRSKQSIADGSNIIRKSYYTPRTNRLEQDKFIQEHFKITCNKCDLPFETFPQLCKHCRQEHNERAFVTCCGTKFFERCLLFNHLNFHLNPDYFKCQECGKVFGNRSYLLCHIKVHEAKSTHRCNVCDRSFTKKYFLERHKLTHMSKEEKKHPCDDCGKFFANEYVLGLHQRAVHLGVYSKVCELCGQTMPNAYTFKHHMKLHEMSSEASSSSSTSLSVKCDECGLLLAGPLHLKVHCKNQHPPDGKRDYKCHICPKVSPTLRALKKHIQCCHEMGYDFKCTLCEKAFKRADNLKAHMGTHTGTPLYRCTWCPKTFNSDGNMYNHRKKAHPIEWEETKRKKYAGNLPPNFKTTANS